MEGLDHALLLANVKVGATRARAAPRPAPSPRRAAHSRTPPRAPRTRAARSRDAAGERATTAQRRAWFPPVPRTRAALTCALCVRRAARARRPAPHRPARRQRGCAALRCVRWWGRWRSAAAWAGAPAIVALRPVVSAPVVSAPIAPLTVACLYTSVRYLLLLRFLGRDYDAAFRLCDSVASDTALAPDELTVFNALRGANDDRAPDAHAVQLKLSLVRAARRARAAPARASPTGAQSRHARPRRAHRSRAAVPCSVVPARTRSGSFAAAHPAPRLTPRRAPARARQVTADSGVAPPVRTSPRSARAVHRQAGARQRGSTTARAQGGAAAA